jgi:FkbM family methyltransferase
MLKSVCTFLESMTQKDKIKAPFFSTRMRKILKATPGIGRVLIEINEKARFVCRARLKGIRLVSYSDCLDFKRDNDTIRISKRHIVYSDDIINSFDYYFSAVRPVRIEDISLVDYSTPRYHDVVGYDRHPVFFPSFSEPLVTTNQYLSFANLKAGSIVVDLGAYCGLTAIVFKDIVGSTGRVIAVDVDEVNLTAIKKNFDNYKKVTGNAIELLVGAVWNHNRGLEFSVEGNMGSAAAQIVGERRGKIVVVKSYTLTDIAAMYDLDKVDFIKCDIEGAEAVVFEDAKFFERCKPRIIIEPHIVEGRETTKKCEADLKTYGYSVRRIQQSGVNLPLLECYPPGDKVPVKRNCGETG